MEPINIEETSRTPMIRYNPEKNKIEIRGKSIPEDPRDFFNPVLKWFEEFTSSPPEYTDVDVKLEYFNTSSSKCILDVFKKLEAIHKAKHDVEINWYYEEDDEDMLEAGEDYESIIRIPFKMIEIVE